MLILHSFLYFLNEGAQDVEGSTTRDSLRNSSKEKEAVKGKPILFASKRNSKKISHILISISFLQLHIACVRNEYGVVLKNARMTKKIVATVTLGYFKCTVATGAKTCAESFKEGCPINQISDLVQDQNGFGHGALPTVTGKLSDVRPLLRDNVENNQRDAQQKRENKLQKVYHIPIHNDPIFPPTSLQLEVVTGAAINWRQDPDNKLKKEQDDRGQEFDMRQGLNVDRVQSSLLSEKPCTERPISLNITTYAFSVGVSTSSLLSVDSSMDSCHSSMPSTIDMAPSHGSESNKSGKDLPISQRERECHQRIFRLAKEKGSVIKELKVIELIIFLSTRKTLRWQHRGIQEYGWKVGHFPCDREDVGIGNPQARTNSTEEFKLNPRAKLFYPSVANNIGGVQSFCTSFTCACRAKFVPYDNSISGFGGNVAQFSQPDLAQGTTIISSIPPCPLLTAQPVQYPKHQGTAATQALQLCVPQPFMASGHQPLAAAPNVIPALQPSFPLNHPMQLPEANSFFNAKF
ncbi:hypothetical protein SDJN03_24999, partial [Cucurbita argyrosperma subsp. sororia]